MAGVNQPVYQGREWGQIHVHTGYMVLPLVTVSRQKYLVTNIVSVICAIDPFIVPNKNLNEESSDAFATSGNASLTFKCVLFCARHI